MDQQTTIDNPREVKLNDNEQREVVNFVLDCEKKGRDARKKYELDWKACTRAYDCEPDELDDEEMEWASNIVLPWAFDAVESWYAHMYSTLIPRNDQIFTISGRTKEDDPGAEVMQEYEEHRFERNKFPEQFGKALKQLAIKNHTCAKLYWKTDKRVGYDWQEQEDPITGESVLVKTPQETVIYDNVWMDVIDIDNFVMYPIHGDLNKTTRIHCTYRFLEELQAEAKEGKTPYFNIDKLSSKDEYKDDATELRADNQAYDPAEKRKQQGIKIKEAWIHRIKIGEKVYKNYVAVVANDKTLIRFQPNPYQYGDSPFVWLALRPDGDCLYGYGLNSKGLGLLRSASRMFNRKIDEIDIRIHPQHKFYDDGVFNPYKMVSRPGGMIEMADAASVAGNMVPLVQDLGPLQVVMAELVEIKAEFESVTVPKVVKGLIEAGNRTATEIKGVQNNASGKMHVDASHIESNFLKVILERTYAQHYQRIKEGQMGGDPSILEEVARVTQEATETITTTPDGQPLPPEEYTQVELPIEALIEKLPDFLPLPEVDIKVVGYQNQVQKQETLANMAQVLPQVAENPPMAKYLRQDGLLEQIFEAANLDKDRSLLSPEERAAADQQEQETLQMQQDLVLQEQQAKVENEQKKLDLEVMKAQNQHEIDLIKLELERMKLELEARKIEQADRHAEMNASMQADQFDKQLEADKAAKKEKKSDAK